MCRVEQGDEHASAGSQMAVASMMLDKLEGCASLCKSQLGKLCCSKRLEARLSVVSCT